MSIKPKYAEQIFSGAKTVELRKVKPQKMTTGDHVLLYSSSPKKCVTGFFEVASIIVADPKTLWKHVKNHAGIEKAEYDRYFKDANQACGIVIKKAYPFRSTISLTTLKTLLLGFRAPQSYRYLSEDEYRMIIENTGGPQT